MQLHHHLAVDYDDVACFFSVGGHHHFNHMASGLRCVAADGVHNSTTSIVPAQHRRRRRRIVRERDESYLSPAMPLGFISPPLTTLQFQMPPSLASFLSSGRTAVSPRSSTTMRRSTSGRWSMRCWPKRWGTCSFVRALANSVCVQQQRVRPARRRGSAVSSSSLQHGTARPSGRIKREGRNGSRSIRGSHRGWRMDSLRQKNLTEDQGYRTR